MGTSHSFRMVILNACKYAALADYAFGMFWCSLDINACILHACLCIIIEVVLQTKHDSCLQRCVKCVAGKRCPNVKTQYAAAQ